MWACVAAITIVLALPGPAAALPPPQSNLTTANARNATTGSGVSGVPIVLGEGGSLGALAANASQVRGQASATNTSQAATVPLGNGGSPSPHPLPSPSPVPVVETAPDASTVRLPPASNSSGAMGPVPGANTTAGVPAPSPAPVRQHTHLRGMSPTPVDNTGAIAPHMSLSTAIVAVAVGAMLWLLLRRTGCCKRSQVVAPRVVERRLSPALPTESRMPHMIKPSSVEATLVSQAIMRDIIPQLPIRHTASDWKLLFSTQQHGYSLQTLYSRCKRQGPVVVLGMTTEGNIFGAFASQGLGVKVGSYTGSGESFVMNVYPEFRAWRWTHANSMFYVCRPEFLGFGGGAEGFAVRLDASLEGGTSARSATYDNDVLACEQAFKIVTVEVWKFA